MRIISHINELKENRKDLEGQLGFVPTMGALHEGHLSLIRRSLEENEITMVSIFLNPTQFDNPQDLSKYPVSFEEDCALLQELGVDLLFAPPYEDMYPCDYRYKLSESEFSKILCGAQRPGHFDGVLTVVLKLFNLTKPHRAYFGEKDYQQLELIRGMVESLFLDVEIVPCPIIREEDGLAMSSRNRRLSPQARTKAPLLYAELSSGKSPSQMAESLENEGFQIDYITRERGRLFAAVFLEGIRLIDNVKG